MVSLTLSWWNIRFIYRTSKNKQGGMGKTEHERYFYSHEKTASLKAVKHE